MVILPIFTPEYSDQFPDRTTYLIEAPAPPQEAEVVERRTTEIVITPPPKEDIPRSVRDWDDGHRSEKGGGPLEHGGGKSLKDADVHSTRARSPSRSGSEKRELSPIEIIRKPSRSRHRSKSIAGHKSEYIEEEIGESNSMHGPLALIQPKSHHHHHRDERSIKAEIRALEAEKEALKLERKIEKEHRKAERYRDEEIIIERRDDVVKIEKDRKGRMSLVR